MEDKKMKRSWERRLAALDARHGGGLSVNRLLIPCIIRLDACSEPPNPCFFDDASPDNRARVADLQAWRACSARRCGLAQSASTADCCADGLFQPAPSRGLMVRSVAKATRLEHPKSASADLGFDNCRSRVNPRSGGRRGGRRHPSRRRAARGSSG
jgi:hypothetical protein